MHMEDVPADSLPTTSVSGLDLEAAGAVRADLATARKLLRDCRDVMVGVLDRSIRAEFGYSDITVQCGMQQCGNYSTASYVRRRKNSRAALKVVVRQRGFSPLLLGPR